MNYSDDQCMDRFTDEQSNRMVCSLINYRPNLFRIDGGGIVTATASASPLKLSGMEVGTNYQCSLLATNSYGESLSSSVKTIILKNTALTPAFATLAPTADGFKVQVSNYDAAYSWTASTTEGSVTISGSGLVTVTGLTPGQSAMVTISSTRSGYRDGTGNVSGSAINAALIPAFATPARTADGFTVQVSNYDPAYSWTASTTEGSVTISGSGLVTVTGLKPSQNATITVNSTRSGYAGGAANVSESAATLATELPAPPILSSVEVDDGAIHITVTLSGDTSVFGFQISCTDGVTTYTATSSQPRITLTGLINDVAYICRVVAENSIGRSSESVWASSIAPVAIPQGLPIWLLYEASQSPR